MDSLLLVVNIGFPSELVQPAMWPLVDFMGGETGSTYGLTRVTSFVSAWTA
jgi:hypothetical protein